MPPQVSLFGSSTYDLLSCQLSFDNFLLFMIAGGAIINHVSDEEIIQSVLQEASTSNLNLEELLKLQAASLLIRLKEVHCATQVIINQVISGVAPMFDTFLDILQNKFSKNPNDVLTTDEVVSCIESVRGQSLFAGLETSKELEEYINDEEGLIKPVKVTVATKEVVKNNNIKKIDVDFGYVVPFLPGLEKSLNCPEILKCVDNPAPVKPGVFTSPLDGYFYQNHPIVKEDPKTLAVGIYADGVDLTDSASSKSGVHSQTFIYFVIYNIDPKLRSSRRSIFLLGIVKSEVLKKHGYNDFLKDFVAGMNKLSSREGVTFEINGEKRVFHGIFICVCGDNPASQNMGGFKESHFAEKPCRHCYVNTEDLFKSFKEGDFTLRRMDLHEAQVKEVEEYFSLRPCSLKLEICCLLKDVVDSKELSLGIINERIHMFSKLFGVNKPSVIEMSYLENKRLRQTAAETLNLAYMLPFVLRKRTNKDLVTVCKEKNMKCFTMRLQLLDLLMSEKLTYKDIQKIRTVTQAHHLLFQDLYGCAIPKMHYECHLNQILLYGPPRNYWCFGFEGKHAYFKRLLRILRCFKDPAGTFARAHQRRVCGLMLLSKKGIAGPFLQSSDSLGSPVNSKLHSLAYRSGLLDFFPDIAIDLRLTQYKTCSYNGVKYSKNQIIMISLSEALPKFGQIIHMFQHQ
ncbi:hypothetical protein FOCC_FOCC014582, partial [Frankliniella occidentalis]